MRRVVDSDRGAGYSLLCYAVAFGMLMGFVAVPLFILSMLAAEIAFFYLSLYMIADLAFLCAVAIYYTGIFLTSALCSALWEPSVHAVSYAGSTIGAGLSYIGSGISSAASNVGGYASSIASSFWFHDVPDTKHIAGTVVPS